MSELRMGVYRHYKGPLYQVLGLAHDANDETRTCVVYMPLQLDGAHEGPRLAVRTYADFTKRLHDDGSDCPNYPNYSGAPGPCNYLGDLIHRFEYLGPEFKRDMLP